MQNYKAFLYFAVAGMGLIAAPYAQAQKLSPDDQKFVEEAAKGGMMEVHMGQLGADHGNSPAVKTFAQRIISDHTKANDELKALAQKKGVTLPPDDAQLAMTTPVATKTGGDFDKEYAKKMVEDHQKDIALFEKEASSGSDPELKEWASKTLPTLRAHLTEAQSLPK